MTNENKAVVLDLRHLKSCHNSTQSMISRLTEGAKVSEILQSLGGAGSLEIRFATCKQAKNVSSS